ncbi:UNVERIFIED_CONTAM: hypothetical protein NCL1_51980 [Trichonephila clavipes]
MRIIIGMMKAGWPAGQVARQLGHCDCVVSRCWDPQILDMSFSRRPGSGRSRQTSHREDRHIVRNVSVLTTASSLSTLAQVAPSLRAHASSRTKRMCLAEGHLGSRPPYIMCAALDAHPSTAFIWSGATHKETRLQQNGTRSSLVTNPDSISSVMTIVFVCGDPKVNASILPFLYNNTLLLQLV